MTLRPLLAFTAAVALAGSAVAQDGGKIPWNHDPAAAMKDAKKSGKPMMFFFTSLG
ncbi:MAG TPA: hypothetical protein VKF32_00210 [Thermoanaerobaculia bacterium]|nr:hypothetical protein [Thermoanaerobaculia bacterium]